VFLFLCSLHPPSCSFFRSVPSPFCLVLVPLSLRLPPCGSSLLLLHLCSVVISVTPVSLLALRLLSSFLFSSSHVCLVASSLIRHCRRLCCVVLCCVFDFFVLIIL